MSTNQLKGLEHGLELIKDATVEERAEAVNTFLEGIK